MSTNAIILNLRTALLAMVPVVERVGIAWKRPEAYDEWDAIASTLFQQLVVEVLRWSLPAEAREGFQLPQYDLLLPSYAASSWIEVTHQSLQTGPWVFNAFGTENEPFDVVEVRRVSVDGRPLSDGYETCPIDGARFGLRLAAGGRPGDDLV